MVAVTDLPLVAVDTIVNYYFQMFSHNLEKWKFGLQLLKVCRLWRQAASYRIYSHAFIEYKCKSDKVILNTNINLITLLGLSYRVEHIYILIRNMDCLAEFFRHYESLFQFEKSNWKNIKRFRLNVSSPIMFSALANNENQIQLVFPFETFASRMIEYIPNITSLYYNLTDETGVTTTFTNMLFDVYSMRLWQISGNSINFNSNHKLMNVTYVDISLDPSVEHLLPRLNPSILKSLRLKEIPLQFSWKYFKTDESAKNAIEFSSLKILSLIFLEEPIDDDNDESEDEGDNDSDEDVEVNRNNRHELFGFNNPADSDISDAEDEEEEVDPEEVELNNRPNDTHIYTVTFPILQQLFIRNKPGLSITSSTYIFPKVIETVTVIDSIKAASILTTSNLVYLRNVHLQFSHISNDEEQAFYNLTNTILGYCTNNSDYSTISLVKTCFNIDYTRVQWSNLRNLEMLKLEISNLAYILEHCLCIRYVEIGVLDIPDTLDEFQSKMVSLDSSTIGNGIKEINISNLKCNGQTAEKGQLLGACLVTKLINVKKITVASRIWKKDNNHVTETKYSFENKGHVKINEWTIC